MYYGFVVLMRDHFVHRLYRTVEELDANLAETILATGKLELHIGIRQHSRTGISNVLTE